MILLMASQSFNLVKYTILLSSLGISLLRLIIEEPLILFLSFLLWFAVHIKYVVLKAQHL